MGNETRSSYRLFDARRAAGFSQQELAELANMSQSKIHRMETGQQSISVESARILSGILRVTVKHLLPWYDEEAEAEAENIMANLRAARGYTQQQLAELVGTSQPQIQRLENGLRPLARHWAEKIAPVLGTTPAYLMFGDEGRASPVNHEPVKAEAETPVMDAARRLHEMLPLTIMSRGVLYTLLDLMTMEGGPIGPGKGALPVRLGMSAEQLVVFIADLEDHGLVEFTADNRLDSKLRQKGGR